MEFSGEYRIPVSQQKVWEALNDPDVLQRSIAGCRQLDKVSDTAFTAIVTTSIGPISVTFRGALELSELNAPHGYTLTGQGQGGAAGFARMTARVKLEQLSPEETWLRYTAEAEIGGKLASVGSRLVQSVAKKNADDFFTAFSSQLTGQTDIAASEAQAAQISSEALRPVANIPPMAGGGLGAPVPAWLVVFTAALGVGLGYCLALVVR